MPDLMRMRFGAVCVLVAMPLYVRGQIAPEPTVMDVLARVEQNYAAHLKAVPNLIAEEHMTTDISRGPGAMVADGRILGMPTGHGIEADSVFTLRRVEARDPNQLPTLTETREIKAIDHRPAEPGATLDTPTMFYGAFSYASGFLLPELTDCYEYKLKANQKLHGRPVLVIEYGSKGNRLQDAKCPIHEPLFGQAYLDTTTMEIVRLEQSRPKHMLVQTDPQTKQETAVEVTWHWAIDYVPVELDGRTFWLAKTVSATMRSNTQDIGSMSGAWSFLASYRNYRLLTVHSRILPASE